VPKLRGFSTGDATSLADAFPRVCRSTFGTRAFSAAGPTVWNSLPDHLCDPAVDSEQFRQDLKMKAYLFAGHSKCWCIRGVYIIALYKLTLTYLLKKKAGSCCGVAAR